MSSQVMSPSSPTVGETTSLNSGFVRTANRMGCMSLRPTPTMQRWIDDARLHQGRYLDIGCAYGVATIAAIRAGARVVACDCCPDHLRKVQHLTPLYALSRLTTVKASFPDGIDDSLGPFDAILMAKVLHFFDGATLRRALWRCWELLAPGGRLYLSTMSPEGMSEVVTEAYHRRVEENNPWPGIFDLSYSGLSEEVREHLPLTVHLLDSEKLKAELLRARFHVEQVQYESVDIEEIELIGSRVTYATAVAVKQRRN